MNKKYESFFIYVLCFLFVAGSILFLYKFYTLQEPNFYAFSIFLIAILILILLHDKLDEISFSKEGFKAKMIDREIEKSELPKSVIVKSEGKDGTIHEKSYDPELEVKEIKEGVK